jgi:hypothetical protein
MAATTIDDVIARLDEIIATARREKSRLGFFPALYRTVTIKVKEGIAAGRFQDGDRMGRLDVAFANRYFEAYDRGRAGEATSACWLASFEAARSWRPLILQHLLLGINAHINLDLGIAAAQVCAGEKLPSLKPDFEEINNILASLLENVQAKIGTLSPLLKWIDHVGGRTDEAVFEFSMQEARRAAWRAAERLAPLDVEQQKNEIAVLDEKITRLARLVRRPGKLISLVTLLIRFWESDDVDRIIEVLYEM